MSKLGFATVLSGFRKSAGKQETKEAKDLDLPKDEPRSVETFLSSAENLSSLSIGNMDLSCSNLSEAKKKENPKKITERIFKRFFTNDNSAKLWISKETEVSEGKIGKEGAKTTSQILAEVVKKIEDMVSRVNASKTETSQSEVFNLSQDSYNAVKGVIIGHDNSDVRRVSSTFLDGVAAFTYQKQDGTNGTEPSDKQDPKTDDKVKDDQKDQSAQPSAKNGLATPDYLEQPKEDNSKDGASEGKDSETETNNTTNNQ